MALSALFYSVHFLFVCKKKTNSASVAGGMVRDYVCEMRRDGAFIVKYGRDGACTVSTLIFQDFFGEELQLHAGFAEHLLRLGAGMVLFLAHHTGDAAVDDEHGADTAGGHSAI